MWCQLVTSGRSPEAWGNGTGAATGQGHVTLEPVIFFRGNVCSLKWILLVFLFQVLLYAHPQKNFTSH